MRFFSSPWRFVFSETPSVRTMVSQENGSLHSQQPPLKAKKFMFRTLSAVESPGVRMSSLVRSYSTTANGTTAMRTASNQACFFSVQSYVFVIWVPCFVTDMVTRADTVLWKNDPSRRVASTRHLSAALNKLEIFSTWTHFQILVL